MNPLSSRTVAVTLAALLVAPASLASRTLPGAPAPAPSFAEPSLSPDHREIAFVSGGDIWTVPYAGGEARLLVSHPATESRPMWSPDGTRLAFISNRTGNGDIYVLTIGTSELTRITYDDVNDQLDNWAPDGKSLYFSSTSRDISAMADVFRVSATGGTPVQVAADRYASEYWAAPAPDGHTIAITARGMPFAQWWRHGHSHLDESEIWLVHDIAAGTSATPKYEQVTTGGAKSAWPMWTPNGATLYFMSDRNGNENLWSRAAAGGEAKPVTSFTSGRLLWPAISRDGQAIVFERDFGVWSYDIASGNTRQVPIVLRGVPAGPAAEHLSLTNGIQQLALSPDAKKVAFVVHGELFAAGAKDGGDATRVTITPASEEQLAWAPDSRRIAYSSDREGNWHLFLYDFTTRGESQLTKGAGSEINPRWSPDGKRLAYERNGRELHVLDVATGADRTVATTALSRPPFVDQREVVWSPDGRWLAYATSTGPKQFANVFVVPSDGGAPRQVSWLSNANSGGLSWSPDGTFLTLTSGQRTELGEATRIDLVPRTPRFREDQFRELFNPSAPRQPAPRTQQPGPGAPTPAPAAPTPDSATRRDSASAAAAAARLNTRIVFSDIRERASVIPLGVDVNSAVISPDGKLLLVSASAAGQTNLYTYPLDELSTGPAVARQLTSTRGFKSDAQFSPDAKDVYYLESGRINSVNVESRTVRPIAVTAEMDVDFNADKMAVFNQAWSYLRDNFFDPNFHGQNWNSLHEQYGARVADARTPDEMRRIMNLMIGELNASHMGIGGPPAQQAFTGRLGVRFDRAEYERNGRLRITEVLPLGPAALAQVKAGDVLAAVDGHAVDAHSNLDELLAYRIGKQTALTIVPASGPRRTVTVQPVNVGTEKGLLYRSWVESRRDYVNKASGGRLGYVHMQDMGEGSLHQLYVDLDAEQHAREGVVVDIRNNNGGFVNAYALDVFTRRPYLTMQSRDQAPTSARSQLGQRSLELPTVLVTNQHSLSDAEDFTEGYRAMHLGKVVGAPTAGWIIFTSNRTLLDGTTVRLPSTRITAADGTDMEMHPRPVDVLVVRPVGESYTGRDSQLDAAVRVLLESLPAKR